MKECDVKLITKKCLGCEKTFGASEESKQKYHSIACEGVATNKDFFERLSLRLPTKAEAIFFVTGKRPHDVKNFSTLKTLELFDLGVYTDTETMEDK